MEATSPSDIFTSDVEPKYERLQQHLMAQLESGVLKPGQLIPTEIALAKSLSISRTTVRQAFAVLERKGVIQRVPGKGTFISEMATSRFQGAGAMKKDHRRSLLGLILPQFDGFYPSLQQAFTSAAAEHGAHVIISSSDQDLQKQADLLLQLADQKVKGIAIVPTSPVDSLTPAHQIRPLQALKIPIVFCHRFIDGVHAPLVTFSGLDVGRLAGRHLLEFGHRRIAFFGSHFSRMGEFYLRGLRESLQNGNVELPDTHVFFGTRLAGAVPKEHEQAARAKLTELFSSAERPTAIFTGFDPEAEFLHLLLSQMGLSVPNDVSLISFGGARREGAFLQHLTSVTVEEDEVGRRAVHLLHEMQSEKRPLEDSTVSIVPLNLSDGKSVGRVS